MIFSAQQKFGEIGALQTDEFGGIARGEYYLQLGKKLLTKPPGEPEVKIRKLAKENFPFQKCK